MSEHAPHNILQAIADLSKGDQDWALALVLGSRGSTPCKAGAKAVFLADGTILGTIGGGAVEAEAERVAAEALQTGQAVVFEFQSQGQGVDDTEPICGGTMRVLVDPSAKNHGNAFEEAAAAERRRSRGVLITRIGHVASVDVLVEYISEEELDGRDPVLAEDVVRSVMEKEEPRLIEDDSSGSPRTEILFEPVIPRPLLLVAGAGHVGQAVAWQADAVGFEVVVFDDRKEFLAPDRFPRGMAVRCGVMEEEIDSFPIMDGTSVVIVTRGHQHDAQVLAACLDRPAAYIGMIGSRRKVAQMRKDLIESGRATAEAVDRVYAPIGLDIGAKTVPEIATSIVAQLIAVRRNGTAARI